MNILPELMPEERLLVVALPYRVGLSISRVDNTGGDEAAEQELQALHGIIHGFAQDVFGSELVQHVMMETVSRKAEWVDWVDHLERVPDECRRALEILSPYADKKELRTYAARLVEIAEAVALAFREYENMDNFSAKLEVYTSYLKARLRAFLTKTPVRSFDQFLSISSMERRALSRITSALGMKESY